MTTTVGFEMKKGRETAGMKQIHAAAKIRIDERTLSRYENDEIKIKDPGIILKAVAAYKNIGIALAYLTENPVFRLLFGEIKLTDPLYATMAYMAEDDDKSEILPSLRRWSLSGGDEPLLDRIKKKVKAYMGSTINLWLNIYQRDGYAY